ncbi:MAG TPA: RsmE family RNA methyltransferase [bacterium]|nr:RsmE family RNA methyltransferase [bacterium]
MLPLIYQPLTGTDGGVLPLAADNRHYLTRVLRLAAGEVLTVSDGCGGMLAARWDGTAVRPTAALAAVPRAAALPLALLLPLLAANKMTDAVRSAAAYGVDRVVVWSPARGRVPADAGRPERWRAVAEDAGRVAHSAWLPEFSGPLPLAAALAAIAGRRLLWLDTAAPRGMLPELPAAGAALVLGPESGFAEDERAAIAAAGAAAVSLGTATLRIEQAVLAALAVVRFQTA